MIIDSTDLKYMTIYDKKGHLVYEGNTYQGKACGYGKAYWSNGNLYEEGEFGIKGLVKGSEYYPDGSLKFRGEYKIWHNYGPNPPKNGEYYSPEGKLIYSGEFKSYAHGGPGYPFVQIPEGYGNIPQTDHPQIPVITWEYGTVLEVVKKDV